MVLVRGRGGWGWGSGVGGGEVGWVMRDRMALDGKGCDVMRIAGGAAEKRWRIFSAKMAQAGAGW